MTALFYIAGFVLPARGYGLKLNLINEDWLRPCAYPGSLTN